MSREAFVADSLVVDAVIRNLTIIGEAVKQLPETVRQLDDDIPWSLIARFRDLVTHAYFRVELAEVLEIATVEIPELQQRIRVLRDHPGLNDSIDR